MKEMIHVRSLINNVRFLFVVNMGAGVGRGRGEGGGGGGVNSRTTKETLSSKYSSTKWTVLLSNTKVNYCKYKHTSFSNQLKPVFAETSSPVQTQNGDFQKYQIFKFLGIMASPLVGCFTGRVSFGIESFCW